MLGKKQFKRLIRFIGVGVFCYFNLFIFSDTANKGESVDFFAPPVEIVFEERKNIFVNTLPQNEDRPIVLAANYSEPIWHKVPFTAQAPFAEWKDPRQQDGCEEASVLMAMSWINKESLTPTKAKEKILAMSAYQEKNWSNYIDTSAQDTVDRLLSGYYSFEHSTVMYGFSIEDMVKELEKGNIILTPMDGQALHNPYFSPPGPERHMLVVVGYDYQKNEFITNDPGTRKGEAYRYDEKVLYSTMRDYPTGDHLPIGEPKKAIIIVNPG